jgi:hypothetical protein
VFVTRGVRECMASQVFRMDEGRQLLTCNRYGINFGDCFVRNFTNPYEPQIPALCVLEFRSTGLLGTGTSALLGRHALPRRVPSRTVLRRTEREEASMRWTGRFIGFVIPAPSADAVTLDDRPAQRIAVYRF